MSNKPIRGDFAKIGRELAKQFVDDSIRLETIMESNLYKVARAVENDAIQMAPVDTGQLKNSIATKQTAYGKSPTFQVGTLVKYAAHVEYGTKKMSAQPYLRPAYYKNEEFHKAMIKDAMNKL